MIRWPQIELRIFNDQKYIETALSQLTIVLSRRNRVLDYKFKSSLRPGILNKLKLKHFFSTSSLQQLSGKNL